MFNKTSLLHILHWYQNKFQSIPCNHTDVDWLYDTFRHTKKMTFIYDSHHDFDHQRDTLIRLKNYIITFVIGSLHTFLTLVLLNCGLLCTVILTLLPCLWGFLAFQTKFLRNIFISLENQDVRSKNSELLRIDERLLPIRKPRIEIGNWRGFYSGLPFHIANKLPILLILGICLWNLWSSLCLPFISLTILFSSYLLAGSTFFNWSSNGLWYGDKSIPIPQAIIKGHSCVENREGLNMRTYLLMARSIWLDKRTQTLDSYPSVFPKEDANPALDRILIPKNIFLYNRFVWKMHFNKNIIVAILRLNDRYRMHFNEMEKKMGIDEDSVSLYSSDDILERIGSQDTLRLNLDILNDDMMKIHILLDMLEWNWRHYHERWNELFIMLCDNLKSKDFHPVTWGFYQDHAEEEISEPYFLPQYPDEFSRVYFCMDTMMPFTSRRLYLLEDSEKDED